MITNSSSSLPVKKIRDSNSNFPFFQWKGFSKIINLRGRNRIEAAGACSYKAHWSERIQDWWMLTFFKWKMRNYKDVREKYLWFELRCQFLDSNHESMALQSKDESLIPILWEKSDSNHKHKFKASPAWSWSQLIPLFFFFCFFSFRRYILWISHKSQISWSYQNISKFQNGNYTILREMKNLMNSR